MNIEEKRQRIAKFVTYGLGVVAVAIATPIIYLAVKGLIGIAIAGILALIIVNGAPVLGNKFANWKIKAIKAEAAANPIETLQNIRIEKQESLNKGYDALKQLSTAVRNFEDK